MIQNKKVNLGYLEGWLSIVINTLLFAVKFWIGTVSGSVAMVADAWHTLSDTLTSAVVVVGFWVSGKPADEDHPFGHGRAEIISAIIIATLLLMVGFNFFVESINRLYHHRAAVFGLFSIIIFLFSLVIKEALAQFSFWAGKEVKSQSLTVDGWHHRSDAIASGLIVVGAFFGVQYWWLDGVMGIGVSWLILYTAGIILKDAINTLLGGKPDSDLENKISKLIKEIAPEAGDMHHFHVHCYGEHKEATFHLKMSAKIKLQQAHSIVEKIEEAIRHKFNLEATIHFEPRE